jgi:pyridoxamine 5'-phosphate oxidase-like protein
LNGAVSWSRLAAESPDLAAAIRARFEAHPHHVIATLRTDGSPRVSGTNVEFAAADRGDELRIGCMAGAVKAQDLVRDPRYALHSAPLDEQLGGGDAKVSGVAEVVEVSSDDGSHTFRLAIEEASLVEVDGDRLRITSWSPATGTRVRTRA